MKKLITIIFLFLCSIAEAQENNKQAQAILDQLVEENNIVGAAGGYLLGNDISWISSSGLKDLENDSEFTPQTLTRIASIAKPMTALAIMQLVEQNKIDLDEPISSYIKDYPNQQITTRHLLSHTSGIRGYKGRKERENMTEYSTLNDGLSIFRDSDLLFEPGTQYSYTTYGYTVLGVILENVSGMSYGAYLLKNIWDKADMQNTGIEKYGEKKQNQSSLFHRDKKGRTRAAKENNLSDRIPGGGLYTTAEDLLKFGKAVINNTFVTEETLNLMRQHHSLEKERNGYGFGWFLYNPKPNEGAIIGHSGAQTGASNQLVIIPEKKFVAVILSNTSGTFQAVTPATFQFYAIANK